MAGRKRRPKADPKIVVGYVRVSTDEQALGPEAQREAIGAWCAREGAELVEVHADLGVSGGTPVEKRPGLKLALDTLAREGAGVLLVAKRDRLARDVVVGAVAERLVERLGARVLTADGTGNGDGPEQQLMRHLINAFAEYERMVIGARTKAALRVKSCAASGSARSGSGRNSPTLPELHDRPSSPHQRQRRLRQQSRATQQAGRALRALFEPNIQRHRCTRLDIHDLLLPKDPDDVLANAERPQRGVSLGIRSPLLPLNDRLPWRTKQ